MHTLVEAVTLSRIPVPVVSSRKKEFTLPGTRSLTICYLKGMDILASQQCHKCKLPPMSIWTYYKRRIFVPAESTFFPLREDHFFTGLGKERQANNKNKKRWEIYSSLTLKAPITTGRRHFQSMFYGVFRGNNAWHNMWIVCLADDSHVMLSIISSEQ